MVLLGMAGCGNLGNKIVDSLDLLAESYSLTVFDRNIQKAEATSSRSAAYRAVSNLEDMLRLAPDFLIEAASREFVEKEIPDFLSSGVNVICLSSGALANAELRAQLLDAAKIGNSKLYLPVVPPGAEAVSVLRLGGIRNAKYKSSRNIAHPKASETKEIYFSGSVNEAMETFSKALNPAASLAEVGLGYEMTMTEVAFDSDVQGYEFFVEVESELGRLETCLSGPIKTDWAFSEWAALSTVALINKLSSHIVVGL